MAINGSQVNAERKWKWLSFGAPKGSGKSSFGMTAPGKKLVLQYDLGASTFPPGMDPNEFWVQTYPDSDAKGMHVGIGTERWTKSKEIYAKVITDLDAIVEAFKANEATITLHDGSTVPLPDTLILDGLVRLDTIIVDGFCAMNNITDPSEAMDARGKAGGGTQKFWGRRLSNMNRLFSLVVSLPCHVGLITWEDVKSSIDATGNISVTSKDPDIGGRLNVWGPGLMDASLYHYGMGGKFYVRTQPTQEIQRVGLRNAYGLEPVIDVTIDPAGKLPLPWNRVFDRAAGKVVK